MTPTTIYSTPTDIPSKNPLIEDSKYVQNALYAMVLPTIAGIFVIYWLFNLYMKWKAKQQARKASYGFNGLYEPNVGNPQLLLRVDLDKSSNNEDSDGLGAVRITTDELPRRDASTQISISTPKNRPYFTSVLDEFIDTGELSQDDWSRFEPHTKYGTGTTCESHTTYNSGAMYTEPSATYDGSRTTYANQHHQSHQHINTLQ